MSKKKKINTSGIVYSTDASFSFEETTAVTETLAPEKQLLKVKLETKHRAGKAVTLVLGFTGKPEDMEVLGKALRNYCGTGGAAKNGEIIVQGDQRTKVLQYLYKLGYTRAKQV
jgi:translation initiation factor 1